MCCRVMQICRLQARDKQQRAEARRHINREHQHLHIQQEQETLVKLRTESGCRVVQYVRKTKVESPSVLCNKARITSTILTEDQSGR